MNEYYQPALHFTNNGSALH